MIVSGYAVGNADVVPTKPVSVDAVQLMDPTEDEAWDAALAEHPQASVFHGSAWAKVLRDTYGYRPAYFILSEAGQFRSLLPMMEVKSWLTGRRGVSLPFTDICQPLRFAVPSMKRLIEEAFEWGRRRGWKYLELRGGKEIFPEAPALEVYFCHELGLAGDEDFLFAQLDGPVRTAIRKAERLGLRTEVSHTLEDMGLFYELHCKTRKRHGLPPPPFRFFRNIHRHILSQRKGMVVITWHGQKPVAAGVYFHSAKEAIYKYGASDNALQELRGNNLVMWEAIKWYSRAGFDRLHLGRTSVTNSGLRRFKLGWGASEHKLDYLRYDLRKDCFVSGRDEAFGWYNRIFNRLPLAISKIIGSILYRHVG